MRNKRDRLWAVLILIAVFGLALLVALVTDCLAIGFLLGVLSGLMVAGMGLIFLVFDGQEMDGKILTAAFCVLSVLGALLGCILSFVGFI